MIVPAPWTASRQAAIDGFNRVLAEQQQTEGLARLTLVLFDDEYLVPVRSIPVQEVLPLNRDTLRPAQYHRPARRHWPRHQRAGEQPRSLPENNRPRQVIVAILTDGLEKRLRAVQLGHHRGGHHAPERNRQMDFLFLGANQDAIDTAAQLNIVAAHSTSPTPSARAPRTSPSREKRSRYAEAR